MFDSPLVKARELKARRRYDAALQVLLEALEATPDDLQLKASLADLYYRMNRPRQALAQAGAILRGAPDDHRALTVMGNALLARAKPSEALEYFKLAIQVAPTDYLWGRVARCHLRLKQPQAALGALNEAETYAPPGPGLLGLRAACFRMLGENEAERQALLRAARAAPTDAQGFFTFVWPALSDLSPREAARVSAHLRQNPGQEQNPHLLLFEAECMLKSRDAPGARERLEALRATDPPERILRAAEQLEQKAGVAPAASDEDETSR